MGRNYDDYKVSIIVPDTDKIIPLEFAFLEYKCSEGALISLITWPEEASDYIYGNKECEIAIQDVRTGNYEIHNPVRLSFSDAEIIKFMEEHIHSIPSVDPHSTDPIKAYVLVDFNLKGGN